MESIWRWTGKAQIQDVFLRRTTVSESDEAVPK